MSHTKNAINTIVKQVQHVVKCSDAEVFVGFEMAQMGSGLRD